MYLLSVILGMLLGVGCAVLIQKKEKVKEIWLSGYSGKKKLCRQSISEWEKSQFSREILKGKFL